MEETIDTQETPVATVENAQEAQCDNLHNHQCEDDKNNALKNEKIVKLLVRFSIPCIVSLLISSLYNLVDKAFVGNSALSTVGSGATGIVFPITVIAIAFAWFFGDGTATYLSICQGKNDTENAHKAVGGALLASALSSVVLLALFLPLSTQILTLFGATDQSMSLAKEYYIVIVAGFPVYMISNTLNSIIRADGSPVWAMIAMSSGAILNVVLDAILIIGCNLGMRGAGIATVVGQTLSCVLCLLYLLRSKTFKLNMRSFMPAVKVFGKCVRYGISSFFTQFCIVIMSLANNYVAIKYGALSKYGSTTAISAITCETTIFSIVVNLAIGIALGAQPIIGYNYGANNFERVKKTFVIVLACTLAIGGVFTIINEACPQAFYGLFGKGDALYTEFANKTFRIYMSSICVTCVIKVICIFFQSVGQSIKATVITAVRDMVVFLPLLLTIPIALGVDGIFICAPIADLSGILFALPLIIIFFVKQANIQKNITPLSTQC